MSPAGNSNSGISDLGDSLVASASKASGSNPVQTLKPPEHSGKVLLFHFVLQVWNTMAMGF